jgi:drug/metabolite transporter (DMT)-like permease
VTGVVLTAVLGAALLHALWNSLVKSAGDKFLSSGLVCLWCGLVALVAAIVLPRPALATAPFVIASAILHVVYFMLVGRLYRNADLSVAYPLMRGLAPLLASVIAFLTLAEVPGKLTALGVLILVSGVLLMAQNGLAHGRVDRVTLIVAIANAAVIAAYSVVDGEGARLAGPSAAHAFAYNAWADTTTAIAYAPVILSLRGRAVIEGLRRQWRLGLGGGAAAFVAYALVVWAMTQAPIAAVAALRESSVLFAAVIGVLALGEPFKGVRAAAALVILAGVVVLRLA